MDERYTFTHSGGVYVLDGTFTPNQLMPTTPSHNLVRGRGSTTIHDLSDGLPAPAPLVLVGLMEAATEEALSQALAVLASALKTCRMVSRQNRLGLGVQSASLLAVPNGDDSSQCQVTISFILTNVPADVGTYFW